MKTLSGQEKHTLVRKKQNFVRKKYKSVRKILLSLYIFPIGKQLENDTWKEKQFKSHTFKNQ